MSTTQTVLETASQLVGTSGVSTTSSSSSSSSSSHTALGWTAVEYVDEKGRELGSALLVPVFVRRWKRSANDAR